jgi:DNA-binding CsgD family transcriptional regulator
VSSTPPSTLQRGDRRIAVVVAIVVVQAIAAAFFIGDAAVDIASEEWGLHILAEVLIAFALLAGVMLGAWQTRRMLEVAHRNEQALKVARGAIAEIMASRFAEWRLTEAETEVALFALKGCETAEIAELRQVAEGTVRAQLTSIYAKAGVSSRHALSSLFLEDLIDAPAAHGSRKPSG